MTPVVSYELTNEDRELLKTRLPGWTRTKISKKRTTSR